MILIRTQHNMQGLLEQKARVEVLCYMWFSIMFTLTLLSMPSCFRFQPPGKQRPKGNASGEATGAFTRPYQGRYH